MGLKLTRVNCTGDLPENYLHAVGHCFLVNRFWQISEDLSTCLEHTIPASPSVCLLGNVTSVNMGKSKSHMLPVVFSIAKNTILINWKNKDNLSIIQVKGLLLDHFFMERMSARTKLTEYKLIWAQFGYSVIIGQTLGRCHLMAAGVAWGISQTAPAWVVTWGSHGAWAPVRAGSQQAEAS